MTHLTDHLDLAVWPKRWLKVAVLSLALAGIFSLILVVARTPQLIAHFPSLKGLFEVALVVHVDLSVLVWFLSMSAMLWSLLHYHMKKPSPPFFEGSAWACMLAGTVLMAVSPLTGEWEVLKSNYVPVITNLAFFMGLGLVAASVVVMLCVSLRSVPAKDAESLAGWGIYFGQWAAVAAAFAFAASMALVPDTIRGLAFYETVFWAGGHVLQFVYVQAMLVAWLLMAQALRLPLPMPAVQVMMLAVGPFFALTAFVPFLFFAPDQQEHMDFYTLQMNVVLGIGGIALGLWLLVVSVRGGGREARSERKGNAIYACLITSLLLFFYGGALGAAISGSNTQIPAHYHGSIVAVTLALMGLAYLLLPAMGYRAVAGWRMARLQPWLYAVGQVMHISGLAWSGGYGALRKTAGHAGDGSMEAMAALGMMGAGGMLAIIGGLLFVVVMVRGFRTP